MKVKDKNGFISSSLMFSFFLVFILLTVLVLTSYMHYNSLIKNLNGTILDGLNEHIASKYSGVKNLIKNGDLSTDQYWILNEGASYVNQSNNNNKFLQIKPNTTGYFTQNFNEILNDRVLYVSFSFNMYYPDDCQTCEFSVSFNNNKINNLYYIDNNKQLKKVESNNLVKNDSKNKLQKWILFGGIYRTNSTINEIKFEASNLNYDINNAGGVFGINNIEVVDVTNLYKDNSPDNDEKMIKYLLSDLPYINYDQKYSLPKI